MSTGDTPLLSEVLDAHIEAYLGRLRVAILGRVESYDADKRRAVVQLLPQDRAVTGEGELKLTTITPLVDAPVLHIGSGTIRVKVPIMAGSPCLALFSSSGISRLKAGSSSTIVYDPGTDRHHHESDALIMPIASITGSQIDDDAMIEFTDDGLIRAGGDRPLVMTPEFLAHVHADPTSGFTGPATVPPGPPPPGVDPSFPGTPRLRG